MKPTVLFLVGFLVAISASAGQVFFGNTSTTLLLTNDCVPMFPSGPTGSGYTVGLYTAPFGTAYEGSFTLIAVTPSLSGFFAGRFNAGNISLPGNTGQSISFLLRAWPTACGSTYEAAILSGCSGFLGNSAIGFVVPASGVTPVPSLMGNGYGQVPGFNLTGICPPNPPFTNVALNITRSLGGRHMISWTNAATSYLLEWTPSLAVSNQWQPVIANVANSNGLLWYSSSNSDARFYRLRKL